MVYLIVTDKPIFGVCNICMKPVLPVGLMPAQPREVVSGRLNDILAVRVWSFC